MSLNYHFSKEVVLMENLRWLNIKIIISGKKIIFNNKQIKLKNNLDHEEDQDSKRKVY